jgi:hypothetical protein
MCYKFEGASSTDHQHDVIGLPASVIKSLTTIRRQYDALMTHAASAPGATLGQRLYTAAARVPGAGEAAAALGSPT